METIRPLNEEELSELPKLPVTWNWTRLGELVNDIVVGYVGPITQYLTDEKDSGIRFLSTTHIGDNQFLDEKEKRYVTTDFSMKNKKSEVLDGDIIVARHGDSGKCCIIPPHIKKAQVSNVVIIRPNNNLFISKYILYSFGHLKHSLQKKKVGGVQQVVNTKTITAFPFPLPPLPEQRAIVSRIEQLFSELDNGIANLRLAQEQLKVYRQAVLKKAFEGELTRKWREQQTDLLDARDLREHIRKGREEAAKASGKKVKPVRPLTEDEIAELPGLPEGWGWVKIGDTTLGVEYGTSAKSSEFGQVPVLRMGNIQNGKFDWSDLVYTSDTAEIEKYLLKKDDVLFNRTNSPELVGKTAIYKGERPAIFAGYLIRVNQLPALVVADYLNYFLNCHTAKVYGNSVKTDGVNQSNINGEKLKNYPFPLCSLPEQHAIVEEIETRLSVCDKMAQDIDEALEKAEALRQSILKKAFEGKLLSDRELAEVRMAEDWEPADVLLERIRAERVGNGKK